MKERKGLSLIEIIVYVALLGMVAVFVTNSLVHLVNAYNRARAEREVISNGRLLIETVTNAAAQAQEVYAPTSRFNDDAGQLSLVTSATSTPDHSTAYMDFWADNGVFLMRQEGQSQATLSAASVRVNVFRVERIVQALGREAIKFTFQVSYANAKFPTSITLHATTALRGNY